MEQLNKVELRGNVGNVRFNVVNDRKVANFSLATDYVYKSKDGSPIVDTTWHNVVAWQGRDIPDVSIVEKGACLYVLGRIKTSKYLGSDGTDKIGYEIVASKVSVAEAKREAQNAHSEK